MTMRHGKPPYGLDSQASSSAEFGPTELRLRDLHRSGRMQAMLELALPFVEKEMRRICQVMVGEHGLVEDALAEARLEVWRKIRHFRWTTSFRDFALAIVREVCEPMMHAPAISSMNTQAQPAWDEVLAERHHQPTAPWLRTENRRDITNLRETLEPDERELLRLRVDLRQSWSEIAKTMIQRAQDKECDNPQEVVREAAACRKRFERLKEKIRRHATERGLLPGQSSI